MSKLTAYEQEVVQTTNGMTRYLLSLETGRAETPRSGLFEETPADDVLQRGLSELKRLGNGNDHERNVLSFDLKQVEKGGPQGGVAPIAELRDMIMLSFDEKLPLVVRRDKRWQQAIEETIDILTSVTGYKRLRPRDALRVVDDMQLRDTLISNSGGPLFTKRKDPEVKAASIADAESGKWKDYPAIILFRNYNLKTRMVGMFPFSANIAEQRFIQPLFETLNNAKLNFFAPGRGFESVRTVVSNSYAKGRFVQSSDFEATDNHFGLEAIKEVFSVIKGCFQEAYGDELGATMQHVATIPLVIGINEILHGEHGVSSGSGGTNFIETMFDMILTKYIQLVLNTHKGLYAIGDDCAYESDEYDAGFGDSLERLGRAAGQIIKSEKTTNEPNLVISLQRLIQRGYSKEGSGSELRAVYPTVRALKSIVYPERFHDPKSGSSDMFCAKVFMILENCVDHPLFEQFVKFVCKGQKDLIPFASKQARELDDILRETKLLPGFNPTYNQEKKDTSLAFFESIKIAADMR